MAEFLGEDLIRGSGINCHFVVSKFPIKKSISERAIPIQIFSTEKVIKRKYLKKWLKINDPKFSYSLRDIIDWYYYID